MLMILLLITSIIIRDFRTTFVDGDVTNPEDHPIKNLTYQFEVAFFANFTVMAVVRYSALPQYVERILNEIENNFNRV